MPHTRIEQAVAQVDDQVDEHHRHAVNQRDYPVVTGVFLVVGVAVMLINLIVDLSYGLLDPRVRHR